MKNGQIGVGIVGLGWPGQKHAEGLQAGETGYLRACADSDEKRRNQFVSRFQPEHVYVNQEELLADPEVDAVVTCLPNYLHFSSTLAALEAGKHVMCEKPPTLNAGEMRVLHEEAAKRKLIYFFGRQSRFSSQMLAARQLVSEGRLGDIYFGKAIFIRSRGIPAGLGGWFTDKARAGGGALIDLGVHALDAAWYLLGTPRPKSVSGRVFQNFRHLAPQSTFDVDDSAYGMITFEGGTVLHFEVSWAGNLTDDIPESGWTGRELINTLLQGTKGTIRLHPFALFESQDETIAKVEIEATPEVNPFALQIQNFLDAIRGTAVAINDSRQALYLMEMLDAVYLSSTTGREIPL